MLDFQKEHYQGIVLEKSKYPGAGLEELTDAIIQKIAENVGLEIPQEELEQEAELLMQGYRAKLRYENFSNGGLPFFMMHTQEEVEQIMEDFRRQAANEYRAEKILREVIEAEGLQVTQGELEEEAKAVALRQNTTMEFIKSFLGNDLSMLKRDLLMKKARNLIYTNAKIQ